MGAFACLIAGAWHRRQSLCLGFWRICFEWCCNFLLLQRFFFTRESESIV